MDKSLVVGSSSQASSGSTGGSANNLDTPPGFFTIRRQRVGTSKADSLGIRNAARGGAVNENVLPGRLPGKRRKLLDSIPEDMEDRKSWDKGKSEMENDDLTTPKKSVSHASSCVPQTPMPLLNNLCTRRNLTSVENVAQTPLKLGFSAEVYTNRLPDEKQQRENIYLVCLQHFLGTTVFMIDKLKELGVKHIYCHDKLYSTYDQSMVDMKDRIGEGNVFQLAAPPKPWMYAETLKKSLQTKLWSKVLFDIEHTKEPPFKIIVLDDGGRLITSIPEVLAEKYGDRIFAVEQTTAGYRLVKEGKPNFPWISVATSSIKRNEDPFIGDLARDKVLQRINAQGFVDRTKVCVGLIGGLGNVGAKVAESLKNEGFRVYVYDTKSITSFPACFSGRCDTVIELMQKCAVVIGCTGLNTFRDVLQKHAVSTLITRDIICMSTSSESIEFEELMRTLDSLYPSVLQDYQHHALADVKYNFVGSDNKAYAVTFCNAGFPVTFDTSKKHAVAPQNIAVTRAALLAAVYQWILHDPEKTKLLKKDDANEVVLDSAVQQHITQAWLQTLDKAGFFASSAVSITSSSAKATNNVMNELNH